MTQTLPVQRDNSSILIVDDTPANLQLLAGMLRERGYKTRTVLSGKLALQAVQIDAPDLILLDINMPEMNGYEVCKALKADITLSEIPVIFISALDETLDKVRAFGVGGVDYVAKPFQFEEVEARIRTHLALRRQRRELQENYAQLQQLEEWRDSLVHLIVHDLRNPLAGVRSCLELIEMVEGKTLSPKGKEYVKRAITATDTLNEMIGVVLDVSKMEAGAMKLALRQCDVVELAKEVMSGMEAVRREKQLIMEAPTGPVQVIADADLLRRVMENLVGNSLKFTPPAGWVRLAIESSGARVRVTVQDNGPGIPPEYHQKIFEKFGQVETRTGNQKYSTGLGLAFCKLAVEAHGGQIGVESEVDKGSLFWFELPVNRPQASA